MTSNSVDKMGLRRAPYFFTENGVAMLSSVLKSRRAVQVNIAIMRVFTKIRTLLASHADILRLLDKYDEQFRVVFDAINKLLTPEREPPKKR